MRSFHFDQETIWRAHPFNRLGKISGYAASGIGSWQKTRRERPTERRFRHLSKRLPNQNELCAQRDRPRCSKCRPIRSSEWSGPELLHVSCQRHDQVSRSETWTTRQDREGSNNFRFRRPEGNSRGEGIRLVECCRTCHALERIDLLRFMPPRKRPRQRLICPGNRSLMGTPMT